MLKTLMKRKQIDDKNKELEALRAKDADFEKREAEIAESIEQAKTDEETEVVNAAIDEFDAERKEHDAAKTKLEGEIADLEQQLADAERTAPAAPTVEKKEPEAPAERKVEVVMDTRAKFFGMNTQERDAFFMRDDVKDFLGQVRTCMKEKRALTNVGLTIPEVMLPLLKQITQETSKLIGRVSLRRVGGQARQTIMGSIPEAVWTEMCANLNELSLGFNQTEVDGYKVGGFFAVCNAVLEDNDVNLASEIINALGKSIGKALDKAIIYGTGTKMPLGIVTRLAQTTQPSSYSSVDRPWVDLSGTNLITGTGATGLALFQEIVSNTGMIINDYFENGLTWVMNQKTHTKLLVQSMDKNMNAAIVAGMAGYNTMPVVGGDIVELPFVPDNNIVFGYFDAYLLAERAGTEIGQSEHYRFIEDQTVFKGTARYDGKPVIAEAFAAMTLTNVAPTTSVEFPQDTANT